MVSASKTDASWSTSNAVAQSRNGVLADTEAVSVVVTTRKLLHLVLLATVLPLVLEASAAVGAAALATEAVSEEVSVAEEEAVIEVVVSGAGLVEAIEVGIVVEVADLELATAAASQKVLHPVLVVLPEAAAALEAVVRAVSREVVMLVVMVDATATPAEAQDTATDRHHATTTVVVAAATANPLEVESVVAAATAIVIGNATTTASAPTMETVATTNRASKEGTERFLGLLHTSTMHALEAPFSRILKKSTVSSSPHAQNVGKQPCLTPQSSNR
jgi:hypothetical protein